jgi:hypothetical protein
MTRFQEFEMKRDQGKRRTIIREWMSLPGAKRQTVEQAATFAAKAAETHDLDGIQDRGRRVLAWLAPRTGKA